MARRSKKSLFEKIVIIGVISLAVFGGYKIYQDNKTTIDNGITEAKVFANEIDIVIDELSEKEGN